MHIAMSSKPHKPPLHHLRFVVGYLGVNIEACFNKAEHAFCLHGMVWQEMGHSPFFVPPGAHLFSNERILFDN